MKITRFQTNAKILSLLLLGSISSLCCANLAEEAVALRDAPSTDGSIAFNGLLKAVEDNDYLGFTGLLAEAALKKSTPETLESFRKLALPVVTDTGVTRIYMGSIKKISATTHLWKIVPSLDSENLKQEVVIAITTDKKSGGILNFRTL